MDFNALVMNGLKKIEEEGYLQQAIDKKLQSTVDAIVDDVLGRYGDFGKNLKQQVQAALNVNLEELDLGGYNIMVLNAVKEHIVTATQQRGLAKLEEEMEKLLGDPKREYKLSELIEEMKKEKLEEDSDFHGCEITLHVKNMSYVTFIRFDERSDLEEHQCKYRLTLDQEGKVKSFGFSERELTTREIIGGLHGFERTMFKVFANDCTVIVDEKDVNLEFEGYDYD